MTAPPPPRYLRSKPAIPPKRGRRAEGGIHYSILCDTDRQELFITVTVNDGGGYYSKEITPMARILACLPTEDGAAFAGKVLARASNSRTANQPGFLMAILRHEGLTAAADKPHQHVQTGNLAQWSTALLDLPGDPYVPAPIGETPTVEAAVDPDPAPCEQSTSNTKRPKKAKGSTAATGDAPA